MAGAGGRWEQRWHPLRREWVVYSAHRQQRPWSGESAAPRQAAPAFDPGCYLCPGNERVSGARNPAYEGVFLFDNDLPVVGGAAPAVAGAGGFFRRGRAEGLARVICFDPRHHVTLNDVSPAQAAGVLEALKQESVALERSGRVKHMLAFENKGAITGASNPHPHGQIYATGFVFKHVEAELEAAAEHRAATGRSLFEDLLAAELTRGAGLVGGNDEAVVIVPFFARYAYEAWIFPRRRHATLATLSDRELRGLGEAYQELGRRYDLLFNTSFPYVMSLYQAPFSEPSPDYHLHFVFLPPLRAPGLQKFPAGPEIGGGNFMADTLPEEKAAELRARDPLSYVPLA